MGLSHSQRRERNAIESSAAPPVPTETGRHLDSTAEPQNQPNREKKRKDYYGRGGDGKGVKFRIRHMYKVYIIKGKRITQIKKDPHRFMK